MRDAGVVDQRGSDVRPSMRQLAERAEVTTTTVTKMIFGERRTDPETVATVAEILGVNPVEVSEWAHQARTVRASYRVPSEVHLLSGREQAAISELIRAIAEEREGRGQRPAAIAAETVPDDAMSDLTAEELERRLRTEASWQPPPESADPGPH